MRKVAFVTVRYGIDINGGAECHARMLAERLTGRYEVEVLTTCVKNYVTGDNAYPEGTETLNGVLVRRFKAEPVEPEQLGHFARKTRRVVRLRKNLFKLRLLWIVAALHKRWTTRIAYDLREFKSSVFYSPALFRFIEEHQDEYAAFIPVTIDFPPVYYTTAIVPQKTIVIPTMHYQRAAFRPLQTHTFTRAAYIAFNTEAEQRLARRIFGPRMSPHGIVSVGCELAPSASWQDTVAKYGLPARYLLYVGRIDRDKMQDIFRYFLAYKQTYPQSDLKLVLVGGIYCEVPRHEDIVYTGFVDDHEKTAIMAHAEVVVNPSRFESLSLILLEAMTLQRPMLVNGHCAVLREHCKKSKQAALPYYGQKSFIRQLHKMDSAEWLRDVMGSKGKAYVQTHYSWTQIMDRLTACIEQVAASNVR